MSKLKPIVDPDGIVHTWLTVDFITHADEESEMIWTTKRPTEPGIYLRNNPAATAVVRQDVWEIDGVLRVSREGATDLLENMHESFRWFGPIPAPPGYEEAYRRGYRYPDPQLRRNKMSRIKGMRDWPATIDGLNESKSGRMSIEMGSAASAQVTRCRLLREYSNLEISTVGNTIHMNLVGVSPPDEVATGWLSRRSP